MPPVERNGGDLSQQVGLAWQRRGGNGESHGRGWKTEWRPVAALITETSFGACTKVRSGSLTWAYRPRGQLRSQHSRKTTLSSSPVWATSASPTLPQPVADAAAHPEANPANRG